MMEKLKTIPTQTLIVGVVVVLWLASFVVRQVQPEWTALGPAADAAVTTTIAWWMRQRAKKTGGDDLLSTLVNEVVSPRIPKSAAPTSTATPSPVVPPRPPAVPPPRPATPPPTPNPGGMPWES